MNRMTIPGITLLCFLLCFTTAPVFAAPASISLQRATISVSNIDQALAFYQGMLGFTVSSNTPYDTPAIRSMFHIPEDSIPNLVLLDAGETRPRALALVYADGLNIDRNANARNAPALVFNVTNMDELHQRMLDAAVDVVLPPTVLMGFSGDPVGREAAYLDPDGVRVVLFELIVKTN
jgi:catechol 2,3-dioxygenase-like lactoylglutathione lyase family enzyme